MTAALAIFRVYTGGPGFDADCCKAFYVLSKYAWLLLPNHGMEFCAFSTVPKEELAGFACACISTYAQRRTARILK